jgi:tetrahydromethanopterin S-methyltransferase subunit G
MSEDGVKPPETAEKRLGDIVGDISDKAQQLVEQEIELAKAEVQQKLTRIGKGVAAGAVAGFFLFLMLILILVALGWLFNDLLNASNGENYWWGFGIVAGILLLLAIVGGLLALRFIKAGAPPTPELAIEEAKETRRTIEEVRH